MKELKMNLQMFTEEPNDSKEPTEPTEPKESTEPKEPEDKKYSDDDVDKIISKKFAEWEKKHQKEVDEAKKLAEMNATEKAEYKAKQLESKLNELEQKNTLAEMSKAARKMFTDKDINVTDELLSVLVTHDAEKTKTAVDGFITLFNDTVEKAVKEALKGKSPTKKNTSGITKEQILAIKNPAERKQMIAENIELFD